MSQCGYGYSRSEVVDIASEYAVSLCKRDSKHPLSLKWFHGFMSRWPELKLLKPLGLEQQRARATTIEGVSRYYQELGSILDKYSLKDSPERIYNVDEKGLYTSHTAPAIVTSCDFKPQAVTSGSRSLMTVIGCGNILPFLFSQVQECDQNCWSEQRLALMVLCQKQDGVTVLYSGDTLSNIY